MKTYKLCFAVMIVFFPLLLSAQKNFEISERVVLLSLGERTGYTITIKEMSEKDVIKTLKAWLSETQKKPAYEETGKHELMVDDILLSQFGTTPVDLYFLFEESKGDVNVTGCFVVNGEFLSSTTNPEKYKEGADFMRKFGLRTEKVKVMATLEEAEKELNRKKNEQEELEKKNEQLNKTIDDCTKTIETAKNDLKENATEQENKKAEIAKQQTTLEGVQAELKKYEDY